VVNLVGRPTSPPHCRRPVRGARRQRQRADAHRGGARPPVVVSSARRRRAGYGPYTDRAVIERPLACRAAVTGRRCADRHACLHARIPVDEVAAAVTTVRAGHTAAVPRSAGLR
jgi:hypothetical protein